MAAAYAVIWILFSCISSILAQQVPGTYEYHGICMNMHCNSMDTLKRLENCTVVLGNLKVLLMERTRKEDFTGISFPKLKEVTGFMVVYRVRGLESLGNLFPNLSRIRGADLVYNYALIIYDLPDLLEIGLYSLLKIDRGGVIVWGGIPTCYAHTVDWQAIASGRRIVYPTDQRTQCNVICTCTLNPATNFCWNNRKCQRFIEGPEAEVCDSQCLGCKKTRSLVCSLCRHYTHRGNCVSECPDGTIVLPENQYCITEHECNELGRWSWNKTCVVECPMNYIEVNTTSGTTCRRCDTCKKTCNYSPIIQTLANIQAFERCVYINGSLTIHIRSVLPEAINEMRHYLSVIQEVSDYILIYGSISITSLDFLSSLRYIKGRTLYSGKYSLVVSGMHNLQTLFTANVTNNLAVGSGTLRFYDNPMLCVNQIEKLKNNFPVSPSELDTPQALNGYSGGCDEVPLQLRVEVKNETSAVAIFNRVTNNGVHYSILYVRIPQGTHATFVPETCSESEWDAIHVPSSDLTDHTVHVKITSLRPASSYALCIETYDPDHRHLARSSIVNFNTTVGTPERPFIVELVAKYSDAVVIRWVDHKDYKLHIHHYELYVSIKDISTDAIAAINHCVPNDEDFEDEDYSRHAVVMRPPNNYEKSCESMCGVLSTVTVGAMTEDHFDVCSTLNLECNHDETDLPVANSTIDSYVQTLVLNISSPRNVSQEGVLESSGNVFQVGSLAPYRDYTFRLRACTKDKCSRIRRGEVRTLRLKNADIPRIGKVHAINGSVSIQWRPPKVTNGPVLAYTIEILPILPNMEHLLPRVWCVPSNTTNFTVDFVAAKQYIVTICSTTLGSSYVCSERRRVNFQSSKDIPLPDDVSKDDSETTSNWWWSGIIFGILIYVVSTTIGWLCKFKRRMSDEILLVDLTSTHRNESEPPGLTMSDFVPLYNIPLRESHSE